MTTRQDKIRHGSRQTAHSQPSLNYVQILLLLSNYAARRPALWGNKACKLLSGSSRPANSHRLLKGSIAAIQRLCFKTTSKQSAECDVSETHRRRQSDRHVCAGAERESLDRVIGGAARTSRLRAQEKELLQHHQHHQQHHLHHGLLGAHPHSSKSSKPHGTPHLAATTR